MDIPDQNYLRNYQYKTPANLQARINLHRRFGKNPIPWHRWVFNHFKLQPVDKVLEIGCGVGDLWTSNVDRLPDLDLLILGDLSSGMLYQSKINLIHQKNLGFLVSDAQYLPTCSSFFDIVIANHMLYHVPDISKALLEISRILKPNGIFYAATNGKDHMLEIHQIITKYKPEYIYESREATRFSLENAIDLSTPYFSNTDISIYDDHLEVTDPEALLAYIRSMDRMVEGINQQDLKKLKDDIDGEVLRKGQIYITKSQGLLVAEK